MLELDLTPRTLRKKNWYLTALSASFTTLHANMAASRDKVLATPELLEHILLQLPLHDLLRASRFSKHIQQVMEVSPAIRQALWFEPRHKIDKAEIAIMDTYEPPLEPSIPFVHNGCILLKRIHYLPAGVADKLFVNPFFSDLVQVQQCTYQHRTYQHSTITFHAGAFARLNAKSGGSWRQMLLLQPHAAPATYVFCYRYADLVLDCFDALEWCFRRGLPMSEIAETATHHRLGDLKVNIHVGVQVVVDGELDTSNSALH